MVQLIWICLGGAVGSGARYLLSIWLLALLGPGFPYGTLAVNVIGSFLLGLVMHLGLEAQMLSPLVRMTLGIGVMGGFTTFSSFSFETMYLMHQGAWAVAMLNVGVSVVVCLAACFLGWGLGSWLAAPAV